MKTKPYLCIYHGNCADGFTAAWVVRNALGEENCDFIGAKYGEPAPDIRNYNIVLIVDFSYKRSVLIEMAKTLDYASLRGGHIVIIDHHKTAEEDLKDLNLPNVKVHFDMNHSGAMLTWLYCNMNLAGGNVTASDAPALIQRVEDRDLWRFKFADTRDISANIFSYEYTFENWDKLAAESTAELARDGVAIERKHHKDIKELLAAMQSTGKFLGHEVPIANLPYIYSSDAGHIMSVSEKFAVCYWFNKTGIVFSLRSNPEFKGCMDVSEVAKEFGGGGHKNAAGFQLTIEKLYECMKFKDIEFPMFDKYYQ